MNKYTQFVRHLACELLLIFLSGCATTYECITGDKALRRVKGCSLIIPMFATLGQEGGLKKDTLPKVKQNIEKWNKGFKIETPENENIAYENLSGREYTLRTGQNQIDILNQIGEPETKFPSNIKGCDESWEYKYFTIHFSRKRVKTVVFNIQNAVYYSKYSDFILDFPKVYYQSITEDEKIRFEIKPIE